MPQNPSQTTTVNVRVDENVKRNIEILFESMGMNISTAVNIFFRQCLTENALPFQPKAKQADSLRQVLRDAQEHAKANGTSALTMDEIDEIISEVRREARVRQ